MTTFWASIFVFGLLIFFHELGHFLAAKRADIKVEEFAIGMGPKVFSKQKGETLYSFRLLPLGGFIKMAGMEPEDIHNERGFSRKSVLQRMIVIASGSLMNFVLAAVLFAIVFTFIGVPVSTTQVGNVLEGRPAYEAGLQKGDIIKEVNGEQVTSWQQLVAKIHANPNQEVNLKILRGQKTFNVTLVPELEPKEGIGLIGIESSGVKWETKGIFESLYLAVKQTVQLTALILLALGQMVTGQMAADVVGPVGIVQEIGNHARVGVPYLLNLAAIISINLGLINLLPIPALDGSRLVFLLVEAIRRKPLAPEKENFVHLIGFALLIFLIIVVTYKDISRIFG
jgi:regulator of sigma E protease